METLKIKYKIEFLSDWHCGSGLSAGADLDTLCIKDGYGLPFVPGKTIKGLLREAAEIVNRKNNGFITRVFGMATKRDDNFEEEISEQGQCYFSNGELSKVIKETLINNNSKKETLYRKKSSTKIDENGIAVTHSLRRMEVVVPLTLYGNITDIPDQESKRDLIRCLHYVKRLGTNRNRGLGRCVIEEIEK